MQKVYKGIVKNNKVEIYDKTSFQVNLARLEGQEIGLTIGKYRKNRSSNQNSYYWGVVLEILATDTGYTTEEMHEIIKSKFLKKHLNIKGRELETIGDTKSLNTAEFEELMNKIRNWSSLELNIYIPEPNEYSI